MFACFPGFNSITRYGNKISLFPFFTLCLKIIDARCCRSEVVSEKNKITRERTKEIVVQYVLWSWLSVALNQEAGHLEHRKSVNCAFQGKKRVNCSVVLWSYGAGSKNKQTFSRKFNLENVTCFFLDLWKIKC